MAASLRIVLYPIYSLSSWRLRRKTTAGAGAGPQAHGLDSGQWLKHFTRDFYPGLADVMHGRAALVGPQTRTAGAIAALAAPWQRLYHEHQHGLLQEALFRSDGDCHADDLFASDALAALQQHDAAAGRVLLRRYLTCVIHDLGQ